ncbi:MAG: 50S ribosomal protein L24 [Candidatus Marinimicrobia bacterium]|mgnify:FL=1|jgi:large subunit ribosomal protein L24|nr:50S ribosomal protein L24 [Candidatus Neomarinimicrobiota bacterium]MBT3840255.1 50S ribosomal protein L24 [Candidatus Neomarinimicrobiota bacterium]MBT4000263.1 50S ribosomal protein L24 [Candidatus Neomarinimicrobiota bacterium]MBT4281802.1 50S ribosomal protein L24 [Candidatus Neomarinimicrobiota bacterium]MBT4580238.1 50S ribosomal protein L24 [Candidatus Neomarinimicrobiota bacterium]
MHVKKGMIVKVISGNNKGMEGKILYVSTQKQRVIVEGVNFMKKATRPSQENPAGGIVEKEASIHVSNVMVVHDGQATRIGYKKLEDGSKIRISKKTNQEIEV